MPNDTVVGYLAIAISALGFGSNYIPVKRCKTGDGLFFQLIFCIAVFVVGCGVCLVRRGPAFHTRAMLGGFLWATGNLVSVPAIKLIGMGLAILMWGSSNMVMGWASGTFGLFGLTPAHINRPGLNYTGVVLAIIALLLYMLVKPQDTSSSSTGGTNQANKVSLYTSLSQIEDGTERLLEDGVADHGGVNHHKSIDESFGYNNSDDDVLLPHVPQAQRSLLGAGIALGSGVCYGCSFDPSQYVIDHHQGSPHGIDYVFSHFTGILATSVGYFLLYVLYKWAKGHRPVVCRTMVAPALLSGTLWAVAMVSWFVANERLGFSATFPLVTSTPGLVASLWGILAFKEITGVQNYLTLTAAFTLTTTACLCIALSR